MSSATLSRRVAALERPAPAAPAADGTGVMMTVEGYISHALGVEGTSFLDDPISQWLFRCADGLATDHEMAIYWEANALADRLDPAEAERPEPYLAAFARIFRYV